jgi:hypothetical protein
VVAAFWLAIWMMTELHNPNRVARYVLRYRVTGLGTINLLAFPVNGSERIVGHSDKRWTAERPLLPYCPLIYDGATIANF